MKKDGCKERLVGCKDSLDPFLHPSQVKESDSSFSCVWPSVKPSHSAQPLGPLGRGGRTVTAAPQSRPVAGPSPP